MEKYVFDGFLLFISLIIIIYSAKKGFVSSVLGTASVVGATVLSRNLSIVASEFIYCSFLRDIVKEQITEVFKSIPDSLTLSAKLDVITASFPVWMLRIAEAAGIDSKAVFDELIKNENTSGEKLIESFTDSVVSPAVTEVLNIALFVIAFVLLIVLFFNISKLLSKVIGKLPVIGKANTFFGFVLGILKACAVVFIACTLLNVIAFLLDVEELKLLLADSIIIQYIIT
ncbi:MAG: CvpA family protein [Clostridia bacterium]|nr:CvpA family protein [Clostridia bacterium]